MNGTKYSVGPKTLTPEWFAFRVLDENRNPPVCYGASEAGVICGLSKYKTALQLYMEKRGLVPPFEGSEVTQWGQILEPSIIKEYSRREHVEVDTPNRMFSCIDMPFISASPDGIADDGRICVEAKCSTWRLYDPEHSRTRDCFGDGIDEVPTDYAMQAQQQMLVMGADRCDIATLFDGNKLRTYRIERNDDAIKSLIGKILAFHNNVMTATPPEPDFNHPDTLNMIKNMWGVDEGYETTLKGDDIIDLFNAYIECKKDIGSLTKKKERVLSELLYHIGDASVATIEGVDRQLVRTLVAPRVWTQKDIDTAVAKLGSVKSKGYVRVTDRKVK